MSAGKSEDIDKKKGIQKASVQKRRKKISRCSGRMRKRHR